MSRVERLHDDFDALADLSSVIPELSAHAGPTLFPGQRIVDGRLRSIKGRSYAPPKQAKSSALATYDLSIDPCDGSAPQSVDLYLKSWRSRRDDRIEPTQLRSVAPIPSLNGHAWIYPADPAMSALPAIADGSRVLRAIPAEALGGPEGPIPTAAKVECLRYKPENRCTLRVSLNASAGPCSAGGPTVLIAKVFAAPDRARSLFRIGRFLHEASSRSEMAFVVPRPVALDGDRGVLWLSELTGTTPVRSTLDRSSVDLIAAALACLHETDAAPTDLPIRGVDQQLMEVCRHLDGIAELFPERANQLAELRQQLTEEVARFGAGQSVVIHGAFRLRQLLLNGHEVGLLDFDGVSLGDPTEDVVDFAIDLDPGRQVDPADRAVLPLAFLRSYQAHSGHDLEPHRLSWYLPTKLLKRAYWLRHAAHHRPAVAAELLDRVDRACDVTGRSWLEELL